MQIPLLIGCISVCGAYWKMHTTSTAINFYSCKIVVNGLSSYVSLLKTARMLNHRVKMVCSNCVCNSVPDEKLVFELELALISSQPWVTAPKHLCMWSGGK